MKFSTEERIVQYIKITLGVFALIFVIGWGIRVTNLLESMVRLQQLNNSILNLCIYKVV